MCVCVCVCVCLFVLQTIAELKEQFQSKDREHEVALHTLKDQVKLAAL